MDLDQSASLKVDTALSEPNPVLFCSQDGSPITFHVEAGKNEKRMIRAVRMVAPAYGGKYIDQYSDMTPHTVLLVTDEGFKKRNYSRPAVCITYVGDCIDCNCLLDINGYLHPWEDDEKWKNLNLFDVIYFFKEKFPVFETPRKRKSQDGRGSAPTSPVSRTAPPTLLSPLSSYDTSLESSAEKNRRLNPIGSSPLRLESPGPDEISTQDPADITREGSPEKVITVDVSNSIKAVVHIETSKSTESNLNKLPEKVTAATDVTPKRIDADVHLETSKDPDDNLPEKVTAAKDVNPKRIDVYVHLGTPNDDGSGKNKKIVRKDRKNEDGNKERDPPSPLDKVSSSVSHKTVPHAPPKDGPRCKIAEPGAKSNRSSPLRSSSPKTLSDVTSAYDLDDTVPDERPRRGRGAQDRYKTWEQHTIVRYLIEHNKFRNLRGVTVWKEMEKKKILPNRPWQSLKNQFLKTILKKLHEFPFLNCEQRNKFLEPPPESSSSDEDSSFFFAGDYNKARLRANRSTPDAGSK